MSVKNSLLEQQVIEDIKKRLDERGLDPQLVFARDAQDYCARVDGLIRALVATADEDARQNIANVLKSMMFTEEELETMLKKVS